MRDDFTPTTKRSIAERAGYVCSNPTCRRNQLGPAPEDSSKSVNLGIAAHVRAAAAGGPRYDAYQTPDERSSINNGLFLCSGCAGLVDKNNGAGYPVEMLHSWKKNHEEWIQGRLNKGELDSASFHTVVWQDVSSPVGAVGHAQTVNITQTGISYSDARDIALDVYKVNFLKLSENAAQVARGRAEEITDKFLAELKERNADAIESLESPGMQYALFRAQKEYARSGDKDLEALLVDILVDRASTQDRTIKQIVLDEALSVAPKLTAEQMDALTVNFLITSTLTSAIVSLESFTAHLESDIVPFIDGLATDTSCYEHLEYTGCGSITMVGKLKTIVKIYQERYRGIFVNGFDIIEWNTRFPDHPELLEWAVTNCLHDASKLQINAVTDDALTQQCQIHDVSDDDVNKLKQLFNSAPMSVTEVEDYMLRECPSLQRLFDVWENTRMSQLTLTTVGIAVAHANFRRRTGLHLDLDVWVK